MTDLVTWLRQQLDEDERLALSWSEDQRHWAYVGQRRLAYDNGAHEQAAVVNVQDSEPMRWERIQVLRGTPDQAAHIATWDPARVLAEVAATRRILDSFAASGKPLTTRDAETAVVRMVLRLLALPYADRPGYDEAWRP